MKWQPKIIMLAIAGVLAACSGERPNHTTQSHQTVAPAADSHTNNASTTAPMPTVPMPAAPVTAEAAAEYRHQPAARPVRQVMVVSPTAQIHKQNTEKYGKVEPNPVKAVAQEPVSTFSIDVDTGSYANVRRFLNDGDLPPPHAVRIEELINYFDYDYSLPTDGKPFAVHSEVMDSPWKTDAKLIKIGIKAKDFALKELRPANLVFLLDVSGSMDSPNKLPLVQKTLEILTERLRPEDKVTIITYSGDERVVLEPTSGADKSTILKAIADLKAGGSTAGEQGIRRAYAEAEKAFIKNGINRILLATDGDFNVGITDFDTLKGLIAEKRKTGISLTTLGYGTGNYNEHLMEQAADAGDGNYSYIDSEQEAKKVLHRQLSSTLATVAQDVKIQVEFNPATVKEYRLVGYENRMLNQEDFNNDKVDAGDIGAGHTVTALYEIVPTGKQGWLEESRYQAPKTVSGSLNEYAFVKLRYKNPNESKSHLLSFPIAKQSVELNNASRDSRWAVAVAAYGQQLQGDKYNGNMTWQNIHDLASNASRPDEFGERAELVKLVDTAWKLSSKKLNNQ